jgi:hypothetical protein
MHICAFTDVYSVLVFD